MEILIKENYQELSKSAAQLIADQLMDKSNSVFLLPTGNTPIGTYNELGKLCQKQEVSFRKATIFNLDEYVGIPKTSPHSYAYFMKKNLFSKIDLPLDRNFIPDSTCTNPKMECKKYDELIKAYGPIDLCLLGIGQNGHIGFNEPGSDPNLTTRLVGLIEDTIKINNGPKQAITAGIKTILSAKKIILLANGKSKALAIKKSIEGKISNSCPASFLQTHKDVTFILDNDAASLLESADKSGFVLASSELV